ncbi:MAG: methyl-accepting chemotaxis protein [Candidatus Poribacteria bacterium]|nr:methyl-accepting chemotaxis protein [Candidatus Poribacteria bacterium]
MESRFKTLQPNRACFPSNLGCVQEVETGTQFASQAGDVLETIAGQIVAVTDMVRQVATAAEQQTATTGEITQNVQQVADVTQQSAKGAQ